MLIQSDMVYGWVSTELLEADLDNLNIVSVSTETIPTPTLSPTPTRTNTPIPTKTPTPNYFDTTNLQPGNSACGGLVFLVNEEYAPRNIIYEGGFLENDVIIDLRDEPTE